MGEFIRCLTELWNWLTQQSAPIQTLIALLTFLGAIAGIMWGVIKWLRNRSRRENQPEPVESPGSDISAGTVQTVSVKQPTAGRDMIIAPKIILPPNEKTLKPPQTNLRLVMGYKYEKAAPDEHIYQLCAAIANDGSQLIKSYGFDLWLPYDILQLYSSDPDTLLSCDREGQLLKISFRNSRVLSMKDVPILPGDTLEILPKPSVHGGVVLYRMTSEQRTKNMSH